MASFPSDIALINEILSLSETLSQNTAFQHSVNHPHIRGQAILICLNWAPTFRILLPFHHWSLFPVLLWRIPEWPLLSPTLFKAHHPGHVKNCPFSLRALPKGGIHGHTFHLHSRLFLKFRTKSRGLRSVIGHSFRISSQVANITTMAVEERHFLALQSDRKPLRDEPAKAN
jgi:hypothetical protein